MPASLTNKKKKEAMRRFFAELADGRSVEDAWAAVAREWLQQGLAFGDEEWDECEARIHALLRMRRIARAVGAAAGRDPDRADKK